MTQKRFDEMLSTQGGVCAICGDRPSYTLQADHAHDETRRVRGLLCIPCNVRLDVLENPEWEAKARSYLETR